MSAISHNLRSIIDHDGGVILDFAHDAMITLNATGAFVWKKLERGELLDQVVLDLARETGTDLATVDRDVREFVALLRARGLLHS